MYCLVTLNPLNDMDENTDPVIPEPLISADLGLWPVTISRSQPLRVSIMLILGKKTYQVQG